MSKIKAAIESTKVGVEKLSKEYQKKLTKYNALIDEFEAAEDEEKGKEILTQIDVLETEIADKIYAIAKVSKERSERMKTVGAARKQGGTVEPTPPAPNPDPIVEPIVVTPEPTPAVVDTDKKGGMGLWGWVTAIGGTALLVTLGINVANGNLPNPFVRAKNRW